MGLFGKKPPRTPAQNRAAKAKGEKAMNARNRRDRKAADKHEDRAKKGKK